MASVARRVKRKTGPQKAQEVKAYKPPSPRQMMQEDAEMMARRAVMNHPVVKKMHRETTRQIMQSASQAMSGATRKVGIA